MGGEPIMAEPGRNATRASRPSADPARLSGMLATAEAHRAARRLKQAETLCRKALDLEPDDPRWLRLLGDLLQQTGRARDAVAPYERALAADPSYAEAHLGLGGALQRLGQTARALESFERAVALKPDLPDAPYAVAATLQALGRLEEAKEKYEGLIAAKPDWAPLHNNYGNVLKSMGQTEASLGAYRRAIALEPDMIEAINNLGTALMERDELDEAERCFRRAVALKPGFVVACNNLGNLLQATGRDTEAIACYERALRIDDGLPELHNNLGNALRNRGESERAIACYGKAIKLRPKFAAAHNNLGNVLKDQGRLEQALAAYRQALAINPRFAEAHNNLGNTARDMGRLLEAEAAYRQALALKPDSVEALNNLGSVLKDCGRLTDALAALRRAMAQRPDFVTAHQNYLMNIQYDPDTTPETSLEAHRAFDRAFAAPLAAEIRPHANVPDPARRLRIGYVSGDFGHHPVGRFLGPVLPAHDRSQFEIVAYSDRLNEDEITAALRAGCDRWRRIVGIGDSALAERIRSDGIDILVDLSGHTADNRLLAFARKPAPVQASWAGYVGTTGLSTMDYLISDARETPAGSERFYTERILRLPDCYVCFAPPTYAPAVGPLPASATRHVTFGCFNNLAKLNAGVIALWARLLKRLPDARLVLKTHQLSDPAMRGLCASWFAAEGIAPARLELQGKSPHRALLEQYNRIDIALDPFPYSGGLTTLESLWMGVPVVTLGGERFAARHAVSHLTAAGLADLVADGPGSYLEIAAGLAADLPRLAALRSGLRERMARSPLLDGPRFTRNLESAYRRIWRDWCERQAASFSFSQGR